MVWLGQVYPVSAAESTWIYVLLVYIYIASVAPVWILLQPRDYLNSFLLYILLLAGFVGMLFYNPEIVAPAFTAFKADSLENETVFTSAVAAGHCLLFFGAAPRKKSKALNDLLLPDNTIRVGTVDQFVTEAELGFRFLATVELHWKERAQSEMALQELEALTRSSSFEYRLNRAGGQLADGIEAALRHSGGQNCTSA